MTPALIPSAGDGPVVVRLKQRSDDWHLWRMGGYGGSDAINLWTARYCTPQEVHKRKLGILDFRSAPTEAMLRGIALEPLARSIMESTLGQAYKPACVIHPKHPFVRASLDGLRRRGRHRRIIEVKVPGKKDHDEVASGRLPTWARPQVRHNLLAAGADVCAFGSLWFDPEADEYDFQYVEVAYSDVYAELDEHLDTLADCWGYIQRHELPPLTKLDVMERTDDEFVQAATAFCMADVALERAKKAREEARQGLIAMCDHPRVRNDQVSVTTYLKAGSINYHHPVIETRLTEPITCPHCRQEAAPALTLDAYRKESQEETRVTALKPKKDSQLALAS